MAVVCVWVMKLLRKYVVVMVFRLVTMLKSAESDTSKGWTLCCAIIFSKAVTKDSDQLTAL